MKLSTSLATGAAILAAALLLTLGLSGLRAHRRGEADRLPSLQAVPDFRFQERGGKTMGLAELRGRVWIADFIFTSCAGTCPSMTQQMRALQDELGPADGLRFVSFTVDPERDTPAVLDEYARRNRAGGNWIFLRGPRADVVRLSCAGFHLGAVEAGAVSGGDGAADGAAATLPASAEKGPEPAADAIAHSRHFALVDRRGWIRGYYDGTDVERMKVLARDARSLLAEAPAAEGLGSPGPGIPEAKTAAARPPEGGRTATP